MTLDGKPVLASGPAVIPMMISAKQLDDSTIETTHSRDGTVVGKTILKVSADGKTLYQTTTSIGSNTKQEPSVRVFQKL